jgi:putative redox protein
VAVAREPGAEDQSQCASRNIQGDAVSANASKQSLSDVVVSEGAAHEFIGRKGASTFMIGGPWSSAAEPNPYDLLSASLGACTAMTIRVHAARKHYLLTRVQVRVSFQRGSEGARDIFMRTISLEGNLSDTEKNGILEIANACPVGKTLGLAADIVTSLGASGATVSDNPSNNDPKDYERDVEELPIPYTDAD